MPKGGHEIAIMVCKLEKLAKNIFCYRYIFLYLKHFLFKIIKSLSY